MPIWLVLILGLSGVQVALTFAVILFPRSRVLNWLTRPIRARFWMRWNTMSYKQAYVALQFMDICDRRSHR
jgi:hypothetical protein